MIVHFQIPNQQENETMNKEELLIQIVIIIIIH